MPMTETTVLGGGRLLHDARLTNLRDVQFAYAAPRATSRREWEEHARWVRTRVLAGAGLLPEPKRTPLHARIYGRIDFDGYSVEKVRFAARPGFLVTGNLYRPLRARGRRPAILSPHGHWQHGRMEQVELGNIPARCAMLARLGFVTFAYDMVGYNDSSQVEHRWPTDVLRQTLLYGIGPFGLQLLASMRAVDFLTSLPDVDPGRIGATGASGGATQTYYLAVVDERVRVVVPVCMVSAHFQGGCTCEEPPLVHLDDLTTVDVAAALAPRPMLLPSVTQDWSNQNPQYEVPAIRSIYALFGAEDRVGNVHSDAPHNYNRKTREFMYAWFLRWLAGRKDVGDRVPEPDFPLPTSEQLRLFPDGEPPRGFRRGPALLTRLCAEEGADFARPPRSRAALRRLRTNWSEAYSEVLGAAEPGEPVSVGTPFRVGSTPQFTAYGRVIGRYGRGEQIPGLWLVPQGARRNGPAALLASGDGKASLFRRGRPGPLLAALLRAGVRVLAIDLLGTGETKPLLDRAPGDRRQPLFYAFNRSLTAHRVQDILTSLAALRQYEGVGRPTLVGLGSGGVAALLARPLAGPLRATAVELRGCPTDQESFWLGEMYHPLIRKVGDVRGAVALGPRSPLLMAGADRSLARWVRAVGRVSGKAQPVRLLGGRLRGELVAAWAS
jgi:dienelactone hydrolase